MTQDSANLSQCKTFPEIYVPSQVLMKYWLVIPTELALCLKPPAKVVLG